jgi:hypothetical protein
VVFDTPNSSRHKHLSKWTEVLPLPRVTVQRVGQTEERGSAKMSRLAEWLDRTIGTLSCRRARTASRDLRPDLEAQRIGNETGDQRFRQSMSLVVRMQTIARASCASRWIVLWSVFLRSYP